MLPMATSRAMSVNTATQTMKTVMNTRGPFDRGRARRPPGGGIIPQDGHRLAKMEVAVKTAGGTSSDLIIPPKALEQIRRLFPAEEELEVAQGDNHVGFRSPFTAVYTRLIEGPYPNYDQVIPRDNDRYAIVDRTALTGALKRMSVVASDQTHRIRMSFNAAMLKFSVSTPDLGEAQDELPIRYEGDPMDIG